MSQETVLKVIYDAIESINEERGPDAQIELSPETVLFGESSPLDSLDLVSMIVDIENNASDAFEKMVSLTDDKAMDRDPVPFQSVTTLRDYILELANA